MANFIPEQENYKELTPFKLAVLQNFPFIEADFDALTNYGLMCKIVEYLNNVISNENAVESNVTNLYNAFVSLQNYTNNYFDNLDVQEEINNKLDSMARDGSLTNLIKGYVDPIIDNLNAEFDIVKDEVASVVSGSPAGVYPTIASLQQADPDHTRIYVVEADGNWYFWNNNTNQWKNGGVYQATVSPVDVNKNATNIDLMKNEYFEMPDWIFQKGSLSNGNVTTSETRIVTTNIITPEKDIILYCNQNYKFAYHTYDDEGVFTHDSGWINPSTRGYGMAYIKAGTHFRVTVSEQTNINVNNIYDFVKQLHITGIYFDKLLNNDSDNIKHFIEYSGNLRNGNYYSSGNTLNIEWANDLRCVLRYPIKFNNSFYIFPKDGYKCQIYHYNDFSENLTSTFTGDETEVVYPNYAKVNANEYVTIKFWKSDNSQVSYLNILENYDFKYSPNYDEFIDIKNEIVQTGNGHYFGEKIETRKNYFNTSNMLFHINTPAGANAVQGMGVNNGVVFQFFSDDKVVLFDLETKEQISVLDCQSGHADCISFMNEKYDENDEFDLCMITDDTTPYVHIIRFTRDSATTVKELKFDWNVTGYQFGHAFDNLNKKLYLIGYAHLNYWDPYSTTVLDYNKDKMIVTEWDYTNLTLNQDGSYTPHLVKKGNTIYMPVAQDQTIFNNKLFIINSTSTASFNASLVIMDLNTFNIDNVIELPSPHNNTEVEGIDFFIEDNKYKLLFSNNYGNVFKITF